MATLPHDERHTVDVATGLVLSLKDDHLHATSLATGKPAWRASCPGAVPPKAVVLGAPQHRVLVVSQDRLRSFEAASGRQAYDVPLDGFVVRGDLRYPWRRFAARAGRTLYLTREHVRDTYAKGGAWLRSVAVEPPTLRALEVASGKPALSFSVRFADTDRLVGDMAPGVLVSRGVPDGAWFRSREQVAQFFDPRTGKQVADEMRVFHAVLGARRSVLLRDTTPPVLTAWDAATRRVAWTTPGIAGAARVVLVSEHHVVVDAMSDLVVFDAVAGTPSARLTLPVERHRTEPAVVRAAGDALVTTLPDSQGIAQVTAVDTASWAARWTTPAGDIQDTTASRVALVRGIDRVLRAQGVTPAVWAREGPALVVLDATTGAQRLRWPIPGPGTSVQTLSCHVRIAPQGYVVRTHWSAP